MINFNRLANTRNRYQGTFPKILCVCSAGLLRSPTIAWVLSNHPYNCNTRAAGVSEEYALVIADQVLVEWADAIVCAEEEHTYLIHSLLKENQTPDKPIFVLHLPDMYETRDPELVELVHKALQQTDFQTKYDRSTN